MRKKIKVFSNLYIRRIIQMCHTSMFRRGMEKGMLDDYTYNEMGLKEMHKNYYDFNNYEFQKGELAYSENR